MRLMVDIVDTIQKIAYMGSQCGFSFFPLCFDIYKYYHYYIYGWCKRGHAL